MKIKIIISLEIETKMKHLEFCIKLIKMLIRYLVVRTFVFAKHSSYYSGRQMKTARKCLVLTNTYCTMYYTLSFSCLP